MSLRGASFFFVIARSGSDVAISAKADVIARQRLPRFARNDKEELLNSHEKKRYSNG